MTKIVQDYNNIPVKKVSEICAFDVFFGVFINDGENSGVKGYIQKFSSGDRSYSIKFLNAFLGNGELLGYTREIDLHKYITWLLNDGVDVYQFNTAAEMFKWMDE
jgi:hypothetical protein